MYIEWVVKWLRLQICIIVSNVNIIKKRGFMSYGYDIHYTTLSK